MEDSPASWNQRGSNRISEGGVGSKRFGRWPVGIRLEKEALTEQASGGSSGASI